MTRRCSYSSAWRTASKPCQDRTDAENTDPIRGGATIGKVAHEITISMGGILNSSTRRSLMQCWHWRFFLSMTRVSFYMGKVLAQDVFGFAGKRLFFWCFRCLFAKKNLWDQQQRNKQSYDVFTGWWFQTFYIFHNIWDNPSHWLIFFKMVKTTNQIHVVFVVFSFFLS